MKKVIKKNTNSAKTFEKKVSPKKVYNSTANTPTRIKPSIKNAIRLPKALVTSWQQTVISLTKFPKGTKIQDTPVPKLIKLAISMEKENLQEVWYNFTQERVNINSKMLTDKGMAVTYLLGFHLGNLARLQHLIKQTSRFSNLDDVLNLFPNYEIFDLGCGSGAMSLGLAQHIKQVKRKAYNLSVKLIDASAPLIEASTIGLQYLEIPNLLIKKHKGGLETLAPEQNLPREKTLAIYSLGYVWNELLQNKNAKEKIDTLFQDVVKQKVPALIVVLEPASDLQSRNAMRLRDDLLEKGYEVLYPCSHQKSCPMLDAKKDWCYSEMAWEKPELQRHIDDILEVERRTMALSGYIFASPELLQTYKLQQQKAGKVMVGRPTQIPTSANAKTKIDYMLCDHTGINKVEAENLESILPRGYRLLDV